MSYTAWTFKTARFTVALEIDRDYGYQYDGDDENGETQAKLDSGEYVAFDSRVVVYLDDIEVASDYLGGSVYGEKNYSDFWKAHRDSDESNRNTLALKELNTCICHYFPDMVREAVRQARHSLGSIHLRKAA